ncbi:CD1B3 protein, partial [Polypterus senegalus]|nr:CD1B3 protein [Polypterus senegalus]
MSFNSSTLKCTAAKNPAIPLEQYCNFSKSSVDYFEVICDAWLNGFSMYGKATLNRKVAPKVSLIQRVSHNPSEVEVVCHVTGFFPRVVEVIWMKNNQEEMEAKSGPILPNEDDTYQVRKTIRINNDDIEKYTYSCHVDHISLTKKLIVLWTYRSGNKYCSYITDKK